MTNDELTLLLVLVLVIESEVRNQRSEVGDQKAKQSRTVSNFRD
jgi:hypothetical protein